MGRRPAEQFGVIVAAIVALSVWPNAAAQSIGPPLPANNEVVDATSSESDAAVAGDSAGSMERSSRLEQRPLGAAREPVTESDAAGATPPGVGSVGRTVAALAVVIVAIFAARFVIRFISRGAGGLAAQLGPAGRAPSGVLSVLARYPVARGQSFVLLRMDQRVLLLSQSGQGFQALAEITEPEEVASLIARTRDEEGESIAARFTSLLRGMERDPELGERNGIFGETPTTVAQAMRLFPETRPSREIAKPKRKARAPESASQPGRTGAEALAAIRKRLAELEGMTS